MPYPDAMTMRAYDAAQGRDDISDDAAEHEAIRAALAKMQEAADTLRGAATSDGMLNSVCSDAGHELERILAHVWRMMP